MKATGTHIIQALNLKMLLMAGLQVLYPNYDLVFMFDHSQGHACQRKHALSAQQMSKSYGGGAQPRMRDRQS